MYIHIYTQRERAPGGQRCARQPSVRGRGARGGGGAAVMCREIRILRYIYISIDIQIFRCIYMYTYIYTYIYIWICI